MLVEAIATPDAAALALTFARFGLWDNAYDGSTADATGTVKNDAADNNNFIGSDQRKFHFRVSDPTAAGTRVSLNWKTLTAGGGDDDAPASQVLTLTELTPGSKVFVSKAVMLVTDDTDRNFPTHSGFTAPDPDAGLRNAGQSNHRTRRAKIDGSIRAEYSPAGGGTVGLTLPLFNRTSPFLTRDSVDNVPAGAATLTPAAMSGVTGGLRWTIKVGSSLNLDRGDNQETVVVTAVTATTFNAVLTKAHNGTATPFFIVGFADERRRVSTRVVRYTNPAFPHLISATDAYIADQFQRVNLRWNQVGIQFDPQPTSNRVLPAGAVDPTGTYGGDGNTGNPLDRIVLADLIPVTPDNTLTVVFVSLSGRNAYTALLNQTGIPVPGGGTVDMDDRFFIFIQPDRVPEDTTLAHECHHALFNRGDAALARQYFTFDTQPPSNFGVPLPDVRIYRRILKRHTADPDNDPNDDNIINWARRLQTVRFPVGHDFDPAPDATTGNKFTQDF